jgi:FKBP-type peptidyl-prolyl cis-trans isomerase FklB
MRIACLFFIINIIALCASCDHARIGNKPKLKNDVDSLNYYLGIFTGLTLKEAGCNDFDKQAFDAAVNEVFKQKYYNHNQYLEAKKIIDNYVNRLHEKQYAQFLKNGREFLAKNKQRKEVITMPSGTQYEVLREGNGIMPKVNDSIIILYKGMTIDGQVFLDKYKHPDTTIFTGGMPGLREALEKMKPGSKFAVYLPTELAYGNNPIPGGVLKPNMAVIFRIELLDVWPKKNK